MLSLVLVLYNLYTVIFGALLLFLLFLDKYYVIFVDDYTRFTWLFFLKHKSEVFTVFLHFKVFVENQFKSKIKILRTDGGGEYMKINLSHFV